MRYFRKMSASIAVVLCIAAQTINGQSIQRQSIAPFTGVTSGGVVGQTGGQPYSTAGENQNAAGVYQGFQQPVNYKTSIMFRNTISFGIYPNPAKDMIHVEFPEKLEGGTAEIIDISGQILKKETFFDISTATFNLAGMIPGVYFLRVSDCKYNLSTRQFIIIE